MAIKQLLALIIFASSITFSQIQYSPGELNFPQIITGTTGSAFLTIYNLDSSEKEFSVEINSERFSVSDSFIVVLPADSFSLTVYYSPVQNVIDKTIIVFRSSDSTASFAVEAEGSGVFNDFYYNSTFNLYDNELKAELKNLTSGHTSLGYNSARDKMFMEIDNKRVNGQGAAVNTLECVYTGRLAVGYTSRTDAQNNYNFNTEHIWPQSTFSQNEPMRSDIYHLYPTDNPANGIRANYPFGNVVSSVTWDSGGSKLGRNAINQIVFEPRDIYKGDISRSVLYFIIRYQNYGNFLDGFQENVLKSWNVFDTVSSIEAKRNIDIAVLQQKRNPFIDHPELVDRIYSFTTNAVRPAVPDFEALPVAVNFDSVEVGDTLRIEIYLLNKGSAALTVSNVNISSGSFFAENYLTVIEPNSLKKINVGFVPDSIKNYSGEIIFATTDKPDTIYVSGIGIKQTVNIAGNEKIIPDDYRLYQNYPNPFNPKTNLEFRIANSGFVTLNVYDILGNEIAALVNEVKEPGKYEVEFDASGLTSGIYFYRLNAGSFVQTNKMILLR